MNITAAPNNGTKGSLNHILKEPSQAREVGQYKDYDTSMLQYKDSEEYVSFLQLNPCGGDCEHFSEEEVNVCFSNLKLLTKKEDIININ